MLFKQVFIAVSYLLSYFKHVKKLSTSLCYLKGCIIILYDVVKNYTKITLNMRNILDLHSKTGMNYFSHNKVDDSEIK